LWGHGHGWSRTSRQSRVKADASGGRLEVCHLIQSRSSGSGPSRSRAPHSRRPRRRRSSRAIGGSVGTRRSSRRKLTRISISSAPRGSSCSRSCPSTSLPS
jgi:hypothetical protein